MVANSAATVALNLPRDVFESIEILANEAHMSSVEIVKTWLNRELDHRKWLNDWQDLRTQIKIDGGLEIGLTSDQIIEKLRQTRHEIWDADYAYLYR